MLNRLILMGRLTADPELKTTTSGIPVTQFSLAVERNYAPKGQDRETDFVNCVAWRNTAEFIARYFSKGRLMVVEAELQSRSYKDKEDRKVTVWEAVVNNAYFGGDRKAENEGQSYAPATPDFEVVADAEDDDLPF